MTRYLLILALASCFAGTTGYAADRCIKESDHVRARDLGIAPGVLPPGPLNAITDVQGVLVGHSTVSSGNTVHTGATAILPHGGNLYQSKVPAGVVVFNGYGKSAGLSQIAELGEIETPIVLTNTMSVSFNGRRCHSHPGKTRDDRPIR